MDCFINHFAYSSFSDSSVGVVNLSSECEDEILADANVTQLEYIRSMDDDVTDKCL